MSAVGPMEVHKMYVGGNITDVKTTCGERGPLRVLLIYVNVCNCEERRTFVLVVESWKLVTVGAVWVSISVGIDRERVSVEEC